MLAHILALVLASASTAFTTPDQLRGHVEYLADDAREGRETGSSGCRDSAAYVADHFARLGLTPIDGLEHFLPYQLTRRGFDPAASSLALAGEPAEAEVDFRPFDFSGDGALTAPLVFGGYGIRAPELGVDDYEGLNVAGKIVLVLRYEPGRDDPDSPFDGASHSRHAWFSTKAEVPRAQGAAGMMIVTGPHHADVSDTFDFSEDLGLALETETPNGDNRLLAVHVSRRWLRRALRRDAIDLTDLQDSLEEGVTTRRLQFEPVEVSMHLAQRGVGSPLETENVAGLLPGTDPALRDEWIVVGAHHDHVGTTPNGRVYNGADDNASGVATLLEVAEEMARAPRRRSILFVTFSGEERGLLGSRAMLARHQIPVERIAFMINLDMVGRNPERPLQILGDGFSTGMRDRLTRLAIPQDLDLDFHGSVMSANSDHAPFFERKIPVLALFTGFHADYHRTGDDANKLSYDRMVQIGGLAAAVLAELGDADASEFPRFVQPVGWLGADLLQEGDQWSVWSVAPGSVAETADLRVDDILLQFDREPLGELHALLDPGVGGHLAVLRRNQDDLEITLERPEPGFLGIQPSELATADRHRLGLAAGSGLTIESVVAGSPAAGAGLRDGDLLLRVDGRDVGPRDVADRVRARGAGAEVTLDLNRSGAPLQVVVTLGTR